MHPYYPALRLMRGEKSPATPDRAANHQEPKRTPNKIKPAKTPRRPRARPTTTMGETLGRGAPLDRGEVSRDPPVSGWSLDFNLSRAVRRDLGVIPSFPPQNRNHTFYTRPCRPGTGDSARATRKSRGKNDGVTQQQNEPPTRHPRKPTINY